MSAIRRKTVFRYALRWWSRIIRLLGIEEEPPEEPPVDRTLF